MFRVVETPDTRENPSPYLNPNPTLVGKIMHSVSSPLSDRCLLPSQHPSGDELSSSNWELHCENSFALRLYLVRHASMGACLYFSLENGAPECDGDKLRPYSCYGWYQQADWWDRHTHLFQKFWDFQGIYWIKVSPHRVLSTGCSWSLSHGITMNYSCTIV